ncbi:Nucleotide-binding universal stress protein, UspA family [Blastococcus aggregatus]|uniref:Nucleotide-binding universal stress protein, UspA family n=1 Tax=Blastococcus aggregatus TaxID=38502 RepID=A0A285V652_9ACTN|nr:universal stress protein [Blastococcus aggregatus]SOC49595.1 Nucleotide-binding universal stress protein, UspA family [Blastococcus aggregatus]
MSQSDRTAPTEAGDRPTVVVGVDGSSASRDVLVHALLAAARRGADLDVVSSVTAELYYLGGAPMVVPDLGAIRDEAREQVRTLVDEVGADAQISSVPGVSEVRIRLVVTERPPAPDLVDRSVDAMLLVVGSRGRGAGRSALLGSVALHCATHAACPVVVVHPSPVAATRPPRVVVGVDGSPASRLALAAAVEEAARLDGGVEVVTSYQTTDYWTDLSSVVVPAVEEVRERLEERARQLVDEVLAEDRRGAVPPIGIEVHEGPADDVLVQRSQGAALLVVGSRGRGAFRALLLGSVALRCAMHADCPVMVVRPAGVRDAADRSEPAMAGM